MHTSKTSHSADYSFHHTRDLNSNSDILQRLYYGNLPAYICCIRCQIMVYFTTLCNDLSRVSQCDEYVKVELFKIVPVNQ